MFINIYNIADDAELSETVSSEGSTPNETNFGKVFANIPEYSPGGHEFIKCKVTRDRRGLDVLGIILFFVIQ